MAEYDVEYTTVDAVKFDLGKMATSVNDLAIAQCIQAASREVDGHTGTRFGYSGPAEARTFDGAPGGAVAVERFTSTDGLLVRVGGGGVYGTTVAASGYVLRPLGAPGAGGAYDTIVIPRTTTWYGDGWPGVEVTAKWGWDYIPAAIEQATRLRAIHLFHRREAPHGTSGYGDDTIAVQATLAADSDVTKLLRPYTDPGIA